jgi:hypothetical protein
MVAECANLLRLRMNANVNVHNTDKLLYLGVRGLSCLLKSICCCSKVMIDGPFVDAIGQSVWRVNTWAVVSGCDSYAILTHTQRSFRRIPIKPESGLI